MSRNSPRKLICGVNDLATTHPDLSQQADGWDPSEFSAGMGRIVKWKCAVGHKWEARIQHRAIGAGCPFCTKSGRRAFQGETDLVTTHPEIAATAYGWDPTQFVAGSQKKQKWICRSGHIYEVKILQRTAGVECLVCSNHQVLSGFNDLETRNPKIAKEANGWDPKTILFGSTKRMPWKCQKGHEWKVTVVSRVKFSSGCPFCSGLLAITGETDLLTLDPELAKEAFGWDPATFKPGSNAKLKWKCTQGHIFLSTLKDRSRLDKKRGCPYCSGRKVLLGFNDLETTHPEKAIMAFGWDPTKVSFGMVKKMQWKCAEGHVWIQSPNALSSLKYGCPVCANLVIRFHVNDLQTLRPDLAVQADGWDPTKYGASSARRMNWKCSLGHTWRTSITNRSSQNSGCPICVGQKVWPGFNDLQTKFPEIASQAEGWDPSVVLAGGRSRRLWRCENNHTWKAEVGSRVHGSGCPSCASTGFDPNLSAYLYLFEHDAKNMYQIGITNAPENRLELHKQRGWLLLDLLGPIDGLLARNWESSILKFIENNGGVMGKQSGVAKFDGYTEAWLKQSFKISNLRSIMEQIRASGN